MQVVSVINQKGGVGKTTTAINLAAYIAKLGKRVLIIDLDPQGNATSGVGIDKRQVHSGLYDGLINSGSIENSIMETNQPGVYLIPASTDLAALEMELTEADNRNQRLAKLLKTLDFDLVLIDCPPSLGILTINALCASSQVIIPVQTEFYALEGLAQLVEVVQRVREQMNPNLELLGVVLTMYDNRTSLAEQVVAEVEKHFGAKVFKTRIPRNVRLAEAPSFGKTIAEHDRWSKGARAYKQLAKEVVDRLAS